MHVFTQLTEEFLTVVVVEGRIVVAVSVAAAAVVVEGWQKTDAVCAAAAVAVGVVAVADGVEHGV